MITLADCPAAAHLLEIVPTARVASPVPVLDRLFRFDVLIDRDLPVALILHFLHPVPSASDRTH